MNQTHSKKFHCIYLLHYYPFDTQVSCQYESSILELDQAGCIIMSPFQICRVDLQLKKFAQRNVELVPDTMELLTDTELTQYFIQAWSLDYNDTG